jgi:hypothetical protein
MNATQLQTTPDFDRMLSAFFKAELPDPFPGLNLPERAELPMPAPSKRMESPRSLIVQSRLSLAASVALVIGGCWYLSSHIGEAPAEHPMFDKNTFKAEIPKEIRKANEINQPKKMP